MSCEFEWEGRCHAGKNVDCPIDFCRAKDKDGKIKFSDINKKELECKEKPNEL